MARTPTSRPTTPEDVPAPPVRQRFRRLLLGWYDCHGRDLPWRRTGDPYHILVSEIMLQQTQVDRVLPKYREWLERYPSLEALAATPVRDVVRSWYPLGYNIRPRRLHAIAREAVARYGGDLPSDEETLLSFKGIGAYTAGAIRSFAFGERAAILDTNVARVLLRVFVGGGDAKAHATRRRLWRISEALVPHRRVFDFNQALIDLGALVCTARRPQCPACPMRRLCASASSPADGPEAVVSPRRPARPAGPARPTGPPGPMGPARPTMLVAAAVVRRQGRYLVTRRPDGTHLAGCWEFPGGKCEPGETPEAALVREIREELDAAVEVGREIHRTRHAYPDRDVELRFFECRLIGQPAPQLGQEVRWARAGALQALEFPPADAELVRLLSAGGTAAPPGASRQAPPLSPARGRARGPAPLEDDPTEPA